MVLSGRRFTGFDVDALRQRANDVSARICQRNVDAFTDMEALAGFVDNHRHVQRRLRSLKEDPL